MKRLKYAYSLHKSKKQKSKDKSQKQQNPRKQYLRTLKTQTMKTLCDFQKICFTKTHFNITSHNTQPTFNTQYKSRSLEKNHLSKTITSKFSQTKNFNIKRQLSGFQANNLKIKRLIRAKTQLSGQQNEKLLKNPFYKIQKLRTLQKKTSVNVQNESVQQQQLQHLNTSMLQINSLQLKTQQQQPDNLFISRNQKHWYFASKKSKFRTVSQPRNLQATQKIQQRKSKAFENQDLNVKTPQKSTTLHSRKESGLSQYETAQMLEFNRFDSIMNDSDIIAEQSREQSPGRIRDKSLTIQYNQIKDYFEKKYQSSDSKNTAYYDMDNFETD